MNQGRTLLLTDQKIYVANGNKITRSGPIENIEAFTFSNVAHQLGFIIHFENEYDYEFSSLAKNGEGFLQ